VKISLIAYPKTPEEISQIEEQLLPEAEAIANHWQPIKAWTQIALTISQNGPALATATATLLAITLTYQKLQNRQAKKSNIKLYNKLSEHNKLIIEATHRASEKDEPTTSAIASRYEMLAGTKIEIEELIKKLSETEKVGLIKKDITSHGDEPRLTWKTKLG
jgi:peroxiredoxin